MADVGAEVHTGEVNEAGGLVGAFDGFGEGGGGGGESEDASAGGEEGFAVEAGSGVEDGGAGGLFGGGEAGDGVAGAGLAGVALGGEDDASGWIGVGGEGGKIAL